MRCQNAVIWPRADGADASSTSDVRQKVEARRIQSSPRRRARRRSMTAPAQKSPIAVVAGSGIGGMIVVESGVTLDVLLSTWRVGNRPCGNVSRAMRCVPGGSTATLPHDIENTPGTALDGPPSLGGGWFSGKPPSTAGAALGSDA